MKAKKQFGQNFLIDEFYINSIIDAINVFSDDLIIEIGPGRGALTSKLKNKGAELICYEVDTDLKPILSKLENNNTKIIYQDFLQTDLSEYKNKYNRIFIVGNLPYYITTPIIEHVISTEINPEEMVIMVQKEVADRFLAKPNSKDYGYFTVYLNYYFDLERIVDVPSRAFNPTPKVNSSVVKLVKKEKNFIVNNEAVLMKLIADAFKQKRKTLKNNLQGYDWEKVYKVLQKYNFLESVRAEQLSLDLFVEIANIVGE